MVSDSADEFELETFLPQRISTLARLTQEILAGALRARGLTVAHWRIFHCLTRLGPSDLNTIAEFAVLPQSSVSRSVARLVKQGLVDAERQAQDRRHLRIAITPSGRTLLAAAISDVRQHWRERFPLPPEQERSLVSDINRIIEALSGQGSAGPE